MRCSPGCAPARRPIGSQHGAQVFAVAWWIHASPRAVPRTPVASRVASPACRIRRRRMRLVSSRFDRLDDAQATPALSLRMRLVLIALNITGWFIVSIGLTMYNKWMFYYSGFHFPLLVSSLHIAIKIPCAMAAMHLLGVPGLRLGRSRQTLQLGVTGCATALDIGLSNLAFLFISVTSYTIGKSSVPMWILLMSVALRLQRPWLGP